MTDFTPTPVATPAVVAAPVKSPVQSKAVWGNLIALVALLAPPLLATVSAITPEQAKAAGIPAEFITAAGIILALYGRLSAKSILSTAAK